MKSYRFDLWVLWYNNKTRQKQKIFIVSDDNISRQFMDATNLEDESSGPQDVVNLNKKIGDKDLN